MAHRTRQQLSELMLSSTPLFALVTGFIPFLHIFRKLELNHVKRISEVMGILELRGSIGCSLPQEAPIQLQGAAQLQDLQRGQRQGPRVWKRDSSKATATSALIPRLIITQSLLVLILKDKQLQQDQGTFRFRKPNDRAMLLANLPLLEMLSHLQQTGGSQQPQASLSQAFDLC